MFPSSRILRSHDSMIPMCDWNSPITDMAVYLPSFHQLQSLSATQLILHLQLHLSPESWGIPVSWRPRMIFLINRWCCLCVSSAKLFSHRVLDASRRKVPRPIAMRRSVNPLVLLLSGNAFFIFCENAMTLLRLIMWSCISCTTRIRTRPRRLMMLFYCITITFLSYFINFHQFRTFEKKNWLWLSVGNVRYVVNKSVLSLPQSKEILAIALMGHETF